MGLDMLLIEYMHRTVSWLIGWAGLGYKFGSFQVCMKLIFFSYDFNFFIIRKIEKIGTK